MNSYMRKYVDSIFPFMASSRGEEKQKIAQQLDSLSKMGPISVTPLNTNSHLKRAITKVQLAQEDKIKLSRVNRVGFKQ